MSLDRCYANEIDILNNQLAADKIDEEEYNDAVRGLEEDYKYYADQVR